MLNVEILKNFRYNFVINVVDAAFFGLGLGFASFYTIIPLFVSTLTDSTLLIGLIASVHTIGWQLPQLFTAGYVSRLRRYKPMVMFMTIHERWPFLGLALVAWFGAVLGPEAALILTLLFLIWHSIGGGLTATPWQSMIGKIIPARRLGTFFGIQASAANLMASAGSILAGLMLQQLGSRLGFALCFLFAGLSMTLSLGFLARTREPENLSPSPLENESEQVAWHRLARILRRDTNFRWFIVVRMLSQTTLMVVAFYTIYAVRQFGMDEQTAGLMAGILAFSQTVANPILGWVGDRWGHRRVLGFGSLVATSSILMAMAAPDMSWFYVIFALIGVALPILWSVAMTFTLEFGEEHERPLYIGLVNTLTAPVTLAAPLLGGWLADAFGFHATFMLAAVCGLMTTLIIQFIVRDPRPVQRTTATQPAVATTS